MSTGEQDPLAAAEAKPPRHSMRRSSLIFGGPGRQPLARCEEDWADSTIASRRRSIGRQSIRMRSSMRRASLSEMIAHQQKLISTIDTGAAADALADAVRANDELLRLQGASGSAQSALRSSGSEDEDEWDDANLAARVALRQHPDVLDALRVWWTTARRSVEQRGRAEMSEKSEMSREQYVLCSMKMYKALIMEWDEDDARESAVDDWQRDCHGRPTLSETDFFDAIFELADIWTTGCALLPLLRPPV